MNRDIQKNPSENSGRNTAVRPSDYAFACTHNQPTPEPEPCPNVMDMGGATGENATICGLNCWYYCRDCEISACSKGCMRDQGCTHVETLQAVGV